MRRKLLIYGIVLIVIIYISIDFYNQNESKKIDQTFDVFKIKTSKIDELTANQLLDSTEYTMDFEFAIIVNMEPEVKKNRYFNLWDYFFPENLNYIKLNELSQVFNDSTNFEIGETTFDQIDYVIRFYDSYDQLILKMWIGLDNRMVYSRPELTNIRSGFLTEESVTELRQILDE